MCYPDLFDGDRFSLAGEDVDAGEANVVLVPPRGLDVHNQLLTIGQLWDHKILIPVNKTLSVT